jgi:regulator of CtrA degradation
MSDLEVSGVSSKSVGKASNTSAGALATAEMISFGARFAASDQFDSIYKEGMALVERTASYLDGPGRKEAKTLQSPLTLTYATESMRLTTRLLELASWLMLHRALKDGEIDQEQAAVRRQRVKLSPIGRPEHVKNFDELPAGLRDLISQSFSLNDRITRLDHAIATSAEPVQPSENKVVAQFAQLEAAFGGLRRTG